ncbi:hypothetical protein ICC18_12630 [Paenibacillus sp. WST5]|uniref:Uncharacterized protein n=1 Tax=Paenibacillus sedimenti TaxID=2770274 RepID=A0A926QIX2_9BACL|nr:hypothetical protein [Paenibacillus sedimenti]
MLVPEDVEDEGRENNNSSRQPYGRRALFTELLFHHLKITKKEAGSLLITASSFLRLIRKEKINILQAILHSIFSIPLWI